MTKYYGLSSARRKRNDLSNESVVRFKSQRLPPLGQSELPLTPSSSPKSWGVTFAIVATLLCSMIGTSYYFYDKLKFHISLTTNNISRQMMTSSSDAKLAWLMSFPGSGTNYTLNLVQSVSQSTTASNYGSVPVSESEMDGPFRSSELNPPAEGYLLTETYCGSWCIDCPLDAYTALETTDFKDECTKTLRFSEVKEGEVMSSLGFYDSEFVKKAVHFIESPFDNVVNRFREHVRNNNGVSTALNADITNFELFCHQSDSNEETNAGLDESLLDIANDVPCHADFYQYVHWHNLAFEAAKSMGISNHVLHNEDYHHDLTGTISDLMRFLELSRVGDMIPFFYKNDEEYFTEEQRSAVMVFVKRVASEETWNHLKRYFGETEQEEILANEAVPGMLFPITGSESAAHTETHESLQEKADSTSYHKFMEQKESAEQQYSDEILYVPVQNDHVATVSNAALAPVTDNEVPATESVSSATKSTTLDTESETSANPESTLPDNESTADDLKVALLLTFPGAGTTYTTNIVEKSSQRTTATNYGNEHLGSNGSSMPVYDDIAGPYRAREEMKLPEKYILTKTHCGSRCQDCPPSEYIETTDSFLEKCLRAPKFSPDPDGEGLVQEMMNYDTDLVQKAVHVVKDPLDSIASRFHHEYKSIIYKFQQPDKFQYTYDREGFHAWCKESDSHFQEEEATAFDSDLLALAKDVPCHAEFYRYIQWHNLASAVVEKLNIPEHIIYYEDYRDDLDNTLIGLLDFLELERVGETIPFSFDDAQDDYTEEQKRAIAKYARAIASEETWRHMKRYFEDEEKESKSYEVSDTITDETAEDTLSPDKKEVESKSEIALVVEDKSEPSSIQQKPSTFSLELTSKVGYQFTFDAEYVPTEVKEVESSNQEETTEDSTTSEVETSEAETIPELLSVEKIIPESENGASVGNNVDAKSAADSEITSGQSTTEYLENSANQNASKAAAEEEATPEEAASQEATPSNLTEGDPEDLKVALLLTFPGAGTTYTTNLVEKSSQRTTATNYGNEHLGSNGSSMPVYNDIAGPYLAREELKLPEKYILTKTHCGSRCQDCPPSEYIETTDSFLEKCFRAPRFSPDPNGGGLLSEMTHYDVDLVKKIVHVVKDPMDSIVTRFHHEYKSLVYKFKQADKFQYTYDREGFQAFCRESDSHFQEEEADAYDSNLLALAKDVPCHAEFYRYVQWHNLAFAITHQLGIPSHVIRYEDYKDDLKNTLAGLLSYLELQYVGETLQYSWDDAQDHYTERQRWAIAAFVKEVASWETWNHLKGYFAPNVRGSGM